MKNKEKKFLVTWFQHENDNNVWENCSIVWAKTPENAVRGMQYQREVYHVYELNEDDKIILNKTYVRS